MAAMDLSGIFFVNVNPQKKGRVLTRGHSASFAVNYYRGNSGLRNAAFNCQYLQSHNKKSTLSPPTTLNKTLSVDTDIRNQTLCVEAKDFYCSAVAKNAAKFTKNFLSFFQVKINVFLC